MITHAQIASALADHLVVMQERAGNSEAIIDLAGFEDQDRSVALLDEVVGGITFGGVTVNDGATASVREAMFVGLIHGLLLGMRIGANRERFS